jgi:tRNA(fMet)-specific endonuclease VapC
MIAFDTDVLSELLLGHPGYVARAAGIHPADQVIPVVVVTEVLRGRLGAIRNAEAGKGKLGLVIAFRLFDRDLHGIAAHRILPYTDAADAQYRAWRSLKLRVGSRDLRIAAIAKTHNARLATRNARDFGLIPNLDLEIWN